MRVSPSSSFRSFNHAIVRCTPRAVEASCKPYPDRPAIPLGLRCVGRLLAQTVRGPEGWVRGVTVSRHVSSTRTERPSSVDPAGTAAIRRSSKRSILNAGIALTPVPPLGPHGMASFLRFPRSAMNDSSLLEWRRERVNVDSATTAVSTNLRLVTPAGVVPVQIEELSLASPTVRLASRFGTGGEGHGPY
jgi:hypothetical protein